MRVVVTGGAGFIGSTFVRGLIGGAYPEIDPVQVVVLDKLTYAGDLGNLAEARDDPRLCVTVGDICDRRLVGSVLRAGDVVVHFAAESHVDRSINSSANFVRTNVAGTDTLLAAAMHADIGKFVHVSTDEVYGSIEHGYWSESRPLEPNSPYAASKASSDLLVRAYNRTHGVPTCITRCSNNYGPYQFPEKIIPLFVTNLLQGKPVPLYGDGSNVRDWLHVDDHCRGIALVCAGGRPGEVYNIGGGTELSNRELTGRLLAAAGADWSQVVRVDDRKGHDLRYAVDHAKIRDELGYEPAIDFERGLAQTVAWYRDSPSWWRSRLPLSA